MSSTTTAPSPHRSPNVNGPSHLANPDPTPDRASSKMNVAAKAADGARKQSRSPVDAAGHKKPHQPRAWQGTNPITQRSMQPATNGVANPPRSSPSPFKLPAEGGSPMRHLNDRMMYLLANLSGHPGNITLKNGEKYTGVLSGTSLDPSEMRYVFKMVKKVQGATPAQTNGASEWSDDYIGVGDNHVMSFDMSDVADFNVNRVILDKSQGSRTNGAPGFRTDSDISGNLAVRERTLQRWEPSADSDVNLSLESTGQSTEWDQFSTNERLFGVRSDYDENLYTTTIDRSHPQYAQRAAMAEKTAREIEGSSALNAHVTEERSQNTAADRAGNEEDLYSGVYRPLPSGQPNTYVPPSKRPPSGQPGVHGAPVDPAIISAQLARPESTSATPSQRTATPPTNVQDGPASAKAESAPKPSASAAEPEAPRAGTASTEKAAPAPKAAPSEAQKPSAALKPSVGAAVRRSGRPENATANVEHDLLDSFKAFSASEKLRMSERQRTLARESKAVKLNDLKKFSLNFKLHTPVPTDLVPILAKDEDKQAQIVEKARRNAQETKTPPVKPPPAANDAKLASRPANPKAPLTQPSPNTPADVANQRPRQGQNQYAPGAMRDRPGNNPNMNQTPQRGQGMLSTRLQVNQQHHKQLGGLPTNGGPQPISLQDTRNLPPSGPSASSSGAQTPISNTSARFNVKAVEFKPNPAASTFQPTTGPSSQSSPRPESASRQEPVRKVQITSFFGGHRPTMRPLDLNETFSPIKRLMKEAAQDPQKARQYQSNGGIQPSYHTPPTWDYPKANDDRGYIQMFDVHTPSGPSPHSMSSGGPVPHPHHVPHQYPGHSQGQTPHHTPRHLPAQPHHGQGAHHFDSQQMGFSHSTSSVHPSPRPMAPYAYGAQPPPTAGFSGQAPVPHYGMSPGMQHVALRQGPGGGPHFVSPPGPAMGGHMMTNQPSNGPFMGMPGNPQMAMYPGAPGPGFAQYPGHMAGGPGANGFPSPRPGAPMMSHQGSQQGHQPQPLVYMHNGQGPPMFAQVPPGSMTPMRGPYAQPHQPHFGSPHQHQQYPHQMHRGSSSGNYSQSMMQQHSLPPQAPPTGPATHGAEVGDEAK